MRALRILIPVLLILAWLGIAGVGGPYFGRISEVSSNDQTTFLPASAEATEVQQLLPAFRSRSGIPAVVVIARIGGLQAADRSWAAGAATSFASDAGVTGVSPVIPSADGKAVEVIAQLDSGKAAATVAALRSALASGRPAGLSAQVTGPAGFTADLVDAFGGIDGLLLGAALVAVLVILLLVYRSPVLPFAVLITAIFALTGSILIVWWLAKAGAVTLNGQVQGILSILVIGAATDYSLLYTSRYREALASAESAWAATWVALKGSFGAIAASAGTVIAGVLCLLLSDLNSNKALGPVAAIGIAMSLLASLTFLPALLLGLRRAAFWPRKPALTSQVEPAPRSLWGRVSGLVARRPRTVWIAAALVLVAAGTGMLGLRANGVSQSDLVLGSSEARDGQVVLADHFAGGTGSPVEVIASAARMEAVGAALKADPGVSAVAVASTGSPSGTIPLGTTSAPPTVVGGRVLIEATLRKAPYSDAAIADVRHLRQLVKQEDSTAQVGGATATVIDTNDTAIRDRTIIIPIVLAVILVILMLLLRSLVMPLLLTGTVVLSFAAALGVSAVVFDQLFRFPGADPSVPLYAFVFLVALGVDYNIFLMTRVREEAALTGPRRGVLRGLTATGGVITSAGVVLAATFAALGVIPILFLAQIAFIVAFGVLLDTTIVRSLLVPALAYDLGAVAWWPSALWRRNRG